MEKVARLWVVLFVVILSASLTICPSLYTACAASKVDKVYFLFAHSLSGVFSKYGQRELQGVKLAVEHINKMGGIKSLGGAKVELYKLLDLTSDAKVGAAALEAELVQAKAKGVTLSAIAVTDLSAMTGASMPVAERQGIPIIASVGMSDLSERGAKYFFRAFPRNEYWAKAQIEFLKLVKEKYMPKLKRVGILYEESAWAQDIAGKGKNLIKEYKIPVDIVADVSYPNDLVDATPLITKLASSRPEVVLFDSTADILHILRAADAMRFKPLWIGGGGLFVDAELLKERGTEGVRGLTSAISCNHRFGNPVIDEVNEEYSKLYPELLFMDEHVVSGYAGTWIAKYGVEMAKSTDPAKVKDALHKLEIITGPPKDEGKMKDGAIISPRSLIVFPSGHLKFNEKGDNIYMTGCVIQWQEVKGKMEPVMVMPEEFTPYRIKF